MDTVVLRYPTDTVHSQDLVPIYFIHSLADPVCHLPGCWCQAQSAQVLELMQAIQTGSLVLTEAEQFQDGNAAGGE